MVFSAEAAQHADRAIPGHAAAHDAAFVSAVAAVVEAKAQGVMATPAAAESLEELLGALAAVEIFAGDEAWLWPPKSRAKPKPHQ